MSARAIGFSVMDLLSDFIMRMHRNSRAPTRSNHGSRPCSNVMRRLKKKAFYRKPKHYD